MNSVNALRVEIDGRLRGDPLVSGLVDKATEYFESEYVGLPHDPLWEQAFLAWVPSLGRDGYLRLTIGEVHRENGGYVDFIDVPTAQLDDEISRNTLMRKLFRRVVIKHRSKVASERIDRFILELGRADG